MNSLARRQPSNETLPDVSGQVPRRQEHEGQVRRDKGCRVPLSVDEDRVVGEEEDEENHREGIQGQVWLQRRPERKFLPVDPLSLEAVEEAKVDDADAEPDNETTRAVRRGIPKIVSTGLKKVQVDGRQV